MQKIQTPLGVKIISIMYYINATIMVIFGILGLFFGTAFFSMIQTAPSEIGGASGIFGAVAGFVGAIFLVLGIFLGYAAYSFWRGKNWTRILIIVLSALAFLSALVNMFSSASFGLVLSLIISGLIIFYLLANKQAKEFFGKKEMMSSTPTSPTPPSQPQM
ncbi:MAG: hypothetical protein US50_C0038G0012 [Candidatus Nomurabacteria bacterium GW2011_GWB1_37_5]|uniref:DUF2127 domain-containing protein n=1 Tax=Candidatus Nomurabacteria bacterium GW2011_GWB1_37_5 TaxID=1618742 RepID=A0A0G0GXI6_9BACT|nr:MAG: hypothetical protein US50_C0038G0012 [Candidatus Nomurabacteria bacterium GW2011_GWB1_37_5]